MVICGGFGIELTIFRCVVSLFEVFCVCAILGVLGWKSESRRIPKKEFSLSL